MKNIINCRNKILQIYVQRKAIQHSEFNSPSYACCFNSAAIVSCSWSGREAIPAIPTDGPFNSAIASYRRLPTTPGPRNNYPWHQQSLLLDALDALMHGKPLESSNSRFNTAKTRTSSTAETKYWDKSRTNHNINSVKRRKSMKKANNSYNIKT